MSEQKDIDLDLRDGRELTKLEILQHPLEVRKLESFLSTLHPDCDIEIEPSGRIVFLPKNSETPLPPFQDMGMPARDFWIQLSSFINSMNLQINDLKGRLAIYRSMLLELDSVEKPRRKFVPVGNNKKAFFAGMQLGKSRKDAGNQDMKK